jgi:GDP-L-fucose synthase
MQRNSRIFVAGGNTFLGSAIVRRLREQQYFVISDDGLDLTDAGAVDRFFSQNAPQYVFIAAGKILGIMGNQKQPADLMIDNLVVQCNLISVAHSHKVAKVLFLGSSCGYPKHCAQPMNPRDLFSGWLEPTSEYYALAKLTGIKLCGAYRQQYGDKFISAIPANPFGPGDDFDPQDAHVIGALLQRMHAAKVNKTPSIPIWGSGTPRREFIYVDDVGSAAVFAMENYDGIAPLNLGSGTTLSIAELAAMVKEVVGYKGALEFDHTKPDGMPSKCLDSSVLLEMGWRPRLDFPSALAATYDYFLRIETGRHRSTVHA